jgi:hypothetical protein
MRGASCRAVSFVSGKALAAGLVEAALSSARFAPAFRAWCICCDFTRVPGDRRLAPCGSLFAELSVLGRGDVLDHALKFVVAVDDFAIAATRPDFTLPERLWFLA